MSRATPLNDAELDLETYLSLPHLLVSATGIAEGSIDTYLSRIGRSRRVVLVVPNLLSAGIILQRGSYLCTQPASIAARLAESCGLEMRPIPLDFPTTSISLLYHQRWRVDPQQMWLRDLASRICSGQDPSL
jgi:DNA-binding transcriptional LysR family regulator